MLVFLNLLLVIFLTNPQNAMYIEKKNCQYCGKTIHGRADKKFCDDYCRNSSNNQKRTCDSPLVRNIINCLKINRNILEGIVADGVEKVKVPKEKLMRMGYFFKYHTHTFTNWKGNTYVYCFEYGYVELGDGWVLVVREMLDF